MDGAGDGAGELLNDRFRVSCNCLFLSSSKGCKWEVIVEYDTPTLSQADFSHVMKASHDLIERTRSSLETAEQSNLIDTTSMVDPYILGCINLFDN